MSTDSVLTLCMPEGVYGALLVRFFDVLIAIPPANDAVFVA